MRKILTCTDGSQYAKSVYDHAAWAAQRTHAAVKVLHVMDPHREHAETTNFSGNLGPDAAAELLAELTELEASKSKVARRRGKAILEDAEAQLKAAGVADVQVEQLHGSLVEILGDEEEYADLVVIGKRGEHADFAKLHLGSNLERVIRSSIRPVLVASRAFAPIRRFLIAFDGGASAQKAVEFAARQPLLQGLECQLLTVTRKDKQPGEEFAAAKQHLAAAGYAVNATVLHGDPDEVIAQTVKEAGIDLLVMGAYGHSKIRQLLVGSTTTAMVRDCHIPVLMFR